jgi:NADH-quinone oxidoreductase subunit G
MADIEIEIDGKTFKAKPNQTVIQVADEAGIYIPRFCYHKHLSIAANCRMCLVEMEKSPKAVPACATPVMPGMKIFTKSQKTIDAQRIVMEFLLINHPLDCPVCDQGGECELQDLSMGYGSSHSNYNECKRSVADQDIGPLIATEMTRCIYCTRCVRFGDEIAGLRELGLTFRGGDERISTYVQQAIKSEVSGNVIDLCPVGALTSKPYRFTARAWELTQAPSISPHDCVGSALNVHTRRGKVMRVVPGESSETNGVWIADRDRYSYTGLYHPDRLVEPMVKAHGKWETVEWEAALRIAVAGLQDLVKEQGAEQLGGLASPNATVEEFYLLQKLIRGLGSQHIDHRLRAVDTRDQAQMGAFPGLNMSIAQIDQADAVLLIGSHIRHEQPMANVRLRQAALKGAQVVVVNPVDYDFNFAVMAKHIVAPQHMVATLKSMAKDASFLKDKQNAVILLGALAINHPQAADIRYWAQQIADATGAKLGFLTEGANAAGAWLAGAIPHRRAAGEVMNQPGMSAAEMIANPRAGYVLLNVEPELDCANASLAVQAIEKAQFVVALSAYRNPTLEKYADVILPITPFTETSGTYVNAAGEWQSFSGMAQTVGSARPAWKVLRVLGNFFGFDGFKYESSEEIKHEVKALVEKMPAIAMQFNEPTMPAAQAVTGLMRIGDIPIYAGDSLVRRAAPLQKAQVLMDGDVAVARIHPETARMLQLEDGATVCVKQQAGETKLALHFDARVAMDAVWVAGATAVSAELGDLMGAITIESSHK